MKNSIEDLVSIIVPSFNKEKFIGQTIQSVIEQNYTNWELIIVDDCSTDSTLSIIHKYAEVDSRIVSERNSTNSGANYCRNRGVAMSKGDFVIFVDADDLLTPDCLEKRLKSVKEFPAYDFWVFPLSVFKGKAGDDSRVWQPLRRHTLKNFLSHQIPWQTMQPIWRRDFLLQVGCFDLTFERLQDVELHTRALLQPGVKFEVFPGRPDCFFRIDEERKNFKAAEFLGRWVRSAVKYYNKFYPLVPHGMRKYLLGTLYKTHSQLAHHFRKGEITRQEYEALGKELMSVLDQTEIAAFKRRLFDLAGYYKTKLPRVPGINRALEALLLHF